jgi:hypothetical protein
MTVHAQNRTYSASAAAAQRPPRRYTQAENRQRRNVGHLTRNGGDFSAVREIAEVVEPSAARITTLTAPLRVRRQVLDYADAAHEFVGTVSGWLAVQDAYAKSAHLANEPDKRRAAVTLILDLTPRPVLPEITDAAILDGTWAAAVTAMAETVDGPLAALLARSWPPNANELRGQISRSERLDRLLRETVDRASIALDRAIERAESQPAPTSTAPIAADPRAELAALGINV